MWAVYNVVQLNLLVYDNLLRRCESRLKLVTPRLMKATSLLWERNGKTGLLAASYEPLGRCDNDVLTL